LHGSALENLWVLGLIAPALGRPYLLSVHSGNLPERWRQIGAVKRTCIRRLIGRAAALISVSDELLRFVASVSELPPRVRTLPAFIPPDPPAHVHPAVAGLRARCEKIVLTCGFPLENYGIAQFVDAVRALQLKLSVGAVIVLYPVTDPSSADRHRGEANRIRRSVEELARSSADVVLLESIDPDLFSSVQAGCDVFVRNTRADGDSVALREAGHLGCQIVASDAVDRPQGSILFRAQDTLALTAAIETALGNSTLGRIQSSRDNARPILDFYHELLSGSA
jgi:glycosyltransferase involved in cell wall biosynthesis